MFYCQENYLSKKALKEAVAKGEQVRICHPGNLPVPIDGKTSVGGPHYPKSHSWYAEVTLMDGVVIKVT